MRSIAYSALVLLRANRITTSVVRVNWQGFVWLVSASPQFLESFQHLLFLWPSRTLPNQYDALNSNSYSVLGKGFAFTFWEHISRRVLWLCVFIISLQKLDIMDVIRPRRPHHKSRTGCLQCKSRKVKVRSLLLVSTDKNLSPQCKTSCMITAPFEHPSLWHEEALGHTQSSQCTHECTHASVFHSVQFNKCIFFKISNWNS